MARLRKKWAAALVAATALSLTLTACGGGGSKDQAATRLHPMDARHRSR